MSDWWRAVEDALGRLGDEGPDPWAEVSVPEEATELTAEQRAFLAQLADTPHARIEDTDFQDDPPGE
jgi:hypothetical protein